MSYAHPTEKSAANELRRYPSPASSTPESVSSSKRRSSLSPLGKVHAKSPLKTSNDKVDYKPFDAIINFLPHGLPDKALLKHAILVTALSLQFLTSSTYTSTASPQPDSRTCSSHNLSNHLPIISPSRSCSSASSSPSESTPDTSPCPSLQPRRLSKLATLTSRAKNRLSHLFHAAPPPPLLAPPEVSSMEESRDVKNAHLVHVLPLGWRPDSRGESDRGDKRRASSSLSPSILAGPSHSAGYTKIPTRERAGGTCEPKLVQSIEQFLLSFTYPLGNLLSGHFGSGLNSGSGTGISSPSSNLKQRPKSAFVFSSASKKHASHRASLPIPSLSTLNLTNISTPLKPVPYLLAPGVFGSCARRSNVRSRCSLSEDDLEQNPDRDTRGNAYTHTDPETTTLTIGEIILLGALDFDHTCSGTWPGNGRAWIGDVDDVFVAGGSPDSGSSSRKVGVGKGKESEVVMETTERNFNGPLTPPMSLSSNDSTESEEEEPEKNRTQEDARPIHPALSTYSPPTHQDDHFQLPPLVVHRDSVCSLHESCDLGFGDGAPVPPMAVSIRPVSRSAPGSGMGLALTPLRKQVDDACKSAYGQTRSSMKGSERKGSVVSALRKIGLWNKYLKKGGSGNVGFGIQQGFQKDDVGSTGIEISSPFDGFPIWGTYHHWQAKACT